MELGPDKIWMPKEWETHANNLLRERYTSSNYIQIPDIDSGDGGIEGFSMDGQAYQMYCPENAMTVDKLYEDQRDKMTQDVGKFIRNSKIMKSYFGDVKIKRWVLVVPDHKTRRIVSHATKKTAEIKAENISYVDNSDFRVLVWDRSEFRLEEIRLLEAGLATLKLRPIEVPESHLRVFNEGAAEFLDKLAWKLGKLNDDPSRISAAQCNLTKSAIISQNMLSELKQDYAEIHERIVSVTSKRAKQLDIEALDSEPKKQKLSYQIQTLKDQLKTSNKLHDDNLEEISKGTVADWLMRCTLDFP